MYNPLLNIAFRKNFLLPFILLTVFINYIRFNLFIKTGSGSFYDLLFFNFNEFFYVTYVITNLFLVLMFMLFPTNQYYNFVLYRFSNKKKWYTLYLKGIVFTSFSFTLGMVLIYFFLAFTTLSFENKWPDQMAQFLESSNISTFTPLFAAVNNLLLINLYLITLGIILITLVLVIKKITLSIIIIVLLITTNTIIHLGSIDSIYDLSFTYNLGGINSALSENVQTYYFHAYGYWFVLITILLIVGYNCVKKVDYWCEK